MRSQSIKVNGGYLEGVKFSLEPVMSWLEVGSLSRGEESSEVTSELEDVLLQAVEEAGLMEVALQPVPHSIPAAHQHCVQHITDWIGTADENIIKNTLWIQTTRAGTFKAMSPKRFITVLSRFLGAQNP